MQGQEVGENNTHVGEEDDEFHLADHHRPEMLDRPDLADSGASHHEETTTKKVSPLWEPSGLSF